MRKGLRNKIWLVVGATLMAAVFGLGFVLGIETGKKWEGYKITRVVDGDTLGVTDLRTGRDWRLRLWGIDAPEAKECGAKEAKEEMEKIIGGREARFLILGVDGFGRYVARIWVNEGEVATRLVDKGWARVDVSTESVYDDRKPSLEDVGELRRVEEKAREAGLGIWGSLCKKR